MAGAGKPFGEAEIVGQFEIAVRLQIDGDVPRYLLTVVMIAHVAEQRGDDDVERRRRNFLHQVGARARRPRGELLGQPLADAGHDGREGGDVLEAEGRGGRTPLHPPAISLGRQQALAHGGLEQAIDVARFDVGG